MSKFFKTLIRHIEQEGHQSDITALISTEMFFDEATLRQYPFLFKWRNETGEKLTETDLKFPGLSANTKIDWTPELSYKFADYIDWKIFPFTLSRNSQFISFECLQKIKSQLNHTLVEQWKLIDGPFIMVFDIDKWDYFDEIVFINQSFFLNHVFFESNITDKIITHYFEKWDWDALSSCMCIEFTEKLLKKYSSKWNWKKITANTAIPWSINLVKLFQNEIDWVRFSERGFFDLNRNKLLPLYQKHFGDLRPLKVTSGSINNN